jgi:hypothetical protein
MTANRVVDGLPARHLAMLRAVAAGRAELTWSRVPDLYVDGRCCTDHAASAALVAAGLVTPAGPGRLGQRVPARLTPAASTVLATTRAMVPHERPDPAERAWTAFAGSGLPTPTDGVERT